MVTSYMMKLGYKEEEINKILKQHVIKRFSDETLLIHIEGIFNYFLDKGYTKEQVIKMTTHTPSIYSYSAENIENKYEDLISLGYTKEQIIHLTRIAPVLFTYDIESLKEKIKIVISLGYTKEQELKMTVIFPGIYSFSKEKIMNKIKYFQERKLEKVILHDTKQLMQSLELTHARYEFLKENGIEINDQQYKELFYSENQFKSKFKITKEEILNKYQHQEYLGEIQNTFKL